MLLYKDKLLNYKDKTFAVAPVMAGDDAAIKTITYRPSCALRVQLDRACCVKLREHSKTQAVNYDD
jgi:hypothetical protein